MRLVSRSVAINPKQPVVGIVSITCQRPVSESAVLTRVIGHCLVFSLGSAHAGRSNHTINKFSSVAKGRCTWLSSLVSLIFRALWSYPRQSARSTINTVIS